MKTFLKTMVAVGAVVIAFAAAPAVMAQSCPDSAPFGHQLGGFLTGLPEGPAAGLASKIGSPAINNGSSPFLCTAASTPGFDFCPPEAGSASDGNVAVAGNWSNPGIAGCPVNSSDPDGSSPIVVVVTSSTGEGTSGHSGKYVIESVGWSGILLQYVLDIAQPGFDPVSGNGGPLGASSIPSPHVNSITNNGNGTANVALSWDAAVSYDDCATNVIGTCPGGGSRAVITGYNLYAITGPCASQPTTSAVGAWGSPVNTYSGLSGSATVPFDTTGVNCTYLALGIQVNGTAGSHVSAHASVSTVDTDGDGVAD
ncbi:MAG TPA: hypothetical protein VFQ07_11305, partial [Candidatus Polarisedimenticolia bacterium]|nr:hypothetical protein [Candidatus Polarisedimenticolia bacterium]